MTVEAVRERNKGERGGVAWDVGSGGRERD